MFAVIKTGGKQYKIQPGDVLQVEKLDVASHQTVTFDEVLLVEDGKNTLVGTPFVEKAVVRAVVLENFQDKKVLVFKKKRRKQYKKTRGHRQELTRVKIEEIALGAEKKKAVPVETRAQAPKPARKKKAATAGPSKKPAGAEAEAKKQAGTIEPAPEKTKKKAVPQKPKTAKPAAQKSPASKAAPKKTKPAGKKVTKKEEKKDGP